MTDYAVTGKKRSGKGLFCVGLIRDALLAGKRVVTNMDIWPDQMLPPLSRATIIRIPDCPTVEDMEAIGRGYEGDYDDERNGLIILDESSKFFNARQWGDKARQPLLDWLIHSGKLGWDVYYQMQGLGQIDKQLRDTQVEYHVSVKRTDRWPIPFITPAAKLFGLNLRFPKMHLGTYRHGCDSQALIVDRKFYRARDLWHAYDTRQVFLDRGHPDACGLHTVLSPWHTRGRHYAWIPAEWQRRVFAVIGYDWTNSPRQVKAPKPQLKGKLPVVQLLAKLPPDQALRHWHRLNALGAI